MMGDCTECEGIAGSELSGIGMFVCGCCGRTYVPRARAMEIATEDEMRSLFAEDGEDENELSVRYATVA
jgi:hypothetical protein